MLLLDFTGEAAHDVPSGTANGIGKLERLRVAVVNVVGVHL